MKRGIVFTLALLVVGVSGGGRVLANHSGPILVGDATPGDDGAPPVCGSASNPCDTIQNGIDHAGRGDRVLVGPGTYVEQVVIDKSIGVIGTDPATTIIQAPGSLTLETDGDGTAIVEITGENVLATFSGFSVQGALAGMTGAVHVHAGASATVRNNIIQGTDALTGSSIGHAITVGSSLDGDLDGAAAATITGNHMSGFHRAGIAVVGAGSRARVQDNIVIGGGATGVTTQQAITVQNGARGLRIASNTVQDLAFTGPAPQSAIGIFLFDAAHGSMIAMNALSDVQTGILVQATESIHIVNNEITDAPGGAAVEKGVWLLGRASFSTGCVGGDGVTPGEGCATRATIINNLLTGDGAGAAVVIGATPDDPFARAASRGTLAANDISGWAADVQMLRTGTCVASDCP